MSNASHCPECGAALAANLPQGLCSRCALVGALEPSLQPGSSQSEEAHSEKSKIRISKSEIKTTALTSSGLKKIRYFGDYELLEEISRGGMGIVYKARQVSLDRIVAVKLLLLGQYASEEFIHRFRIEASAAASLQHPNIVAIHEVGVHQGQHYFAMDFVDGPDLAQLVRDQVLPAKRAAGYVKTIAEAIHFAHTRRILHRDLKPSNILIDSNDQPRVTDFGLAKNLANDSDLTLTGQVLGSPSFMPPEQALGERGKLVPASDVYSLGAILYHALTGRPPFAGETLNATLQQVQGKEPVAPRLLTPSVPADLETVCLKCLEKEPGARFQSALELAEELARFLRGEPIQSRPVSAPEKLWRWCRRKPVLSILIAVIAVLVSSLTITMWHQSRVTRKVADSLRENLYVADMNLAHQALLDFHFSRAAELVDKYHPPEDGETELRGFEWRYLWKQKQGNQLQSFTDHHGNLVACVAFSPDSTMLASASWGLEGTDGKIEIRNLGNGQVVTNLTSGFRGFIWRNATAFSPDGSILAVADAERHVHLYDAVTWRRFLSLEHSLNGNWSPYSNPVAWSPDGRTLAAIGAGEVVFWNTNDWSQRRPSLQTNLPGFGILLAYSPDGTRLVTASYQQVQVWDVETRRLMSASEEFSPSSIAYSPDGHWLAAGGEDGIVRLWNATDIGSEPVRFAADSSTLLGITFSADSKKLITGGMDQVLRVWEVATQHEIHRFQGQASQMWSLARSPDGRLVAGGMQEGAVLLWDVQATSGLAGFQAALRPLGFSADNNHLLAVDSNMTLQYLDLATERAVKSVALPLDDKSAPPRAASADNKNVAFLISTNRIEIWNLEAASILLSLTNQTGRFMDRFLFSPDNQLVVTGIPEPKGLVPPSVEVWHVASAQRVATFKQLNWWAISPDSRMLAGESLGGRESLGGGFGTRLKVVDITTGREWLLPRGHKLNLTSAAFSPNGKLLATTSLDGDARLWEVGTGKPSRVLKGHKAEVHCVTFSPDGRTLVTGGGKGDVKFWSVATGKELLSLHLPGETVRLALFSPDARTLVLHVTDQPGIDRRGADLWSPDVRTVALHDSLHIVRVPSLAEIDAGEKRQAAPRPVSVASP